MKITKNSMVEYTYTIADESKKIIENVDEPVNYIHGNGQQSGMHPKIEAALEGRREGDKIQVSLEPNEGFGPKDPSLILVEDINNTPENMRSLGAETEFRNAQGEAKTFRVIEITDGKITLDGNHPLAGQAFTFTLNILQVREASESELSGEIITGTPGETPPTLN